MMAEKSIGPVLWIAVRRPSPPSTLIEGHRAADLCDVRHSYRAGRVSDLFPIAVLVSGTGTNLQALLDTVHGREARVVGGRLERRRRARALERAEARGVPDGGVRPRRLPRPRRARRGAGRLAGRARRAAGRARRLHGAARRGVPRALPRRGHQRAPVAAAGVPGLAAIEQALDYGVKVFGVTVHFVDAGVDTGPVILQRAVELPDAREPEEVLAALRPLEHALLPRAVALFAARCACRRPCEPAPHRDRRGRGIGSVAWPRTASS